MDYGDKDDGGMNSSRPMMGENEDLERQRPGQVNNFMPGSP